MNPLLLTLLFGGASGFVIGYLATLVLPGKQHISKPEMLLIGTGAGMLGGFVANLFGWDGGDGIRWGRLALSVGFAVLGVILWTNFRNRQLKKAATPDLGGKGEGAKRDAKGGGLPGPSLGPDKGSGKGGGLPGPTLGPSNNGK